MQMLSFYCGSVNKHLSVNVKMWINECKMLVDCVFTFFYMYVLWDANSKQWGENRYYFKMQELKYHCCTWVHNKNYLINEWISFNELPSTLFILFHFDWGMMLKLKLNPSRLNETFVLSISQTEWISVMFIKTYEWQILLIRSQIPHCWYEIQL